MNFYEHHVHMEGNGNFLGFTAFGRFLFWVRTQPDFLQV